MAWIIAVMFPALVYCFVRVIRIDKELHSQTDAINALHAEIVRLLGNVRVMANDTRVESRPVDRAYPKAY